MAPRKILAIKLRALGDTVLMTAPLLEITHSFPQATLDVLVPKSWEPILENFPGIRRIWTFDRNSNPFSQAKLALQLRREKYDLVTNFHASTTSANLARATGAQIRSIHFHGHQVQNRFSTVTIPGKGILKPAIERDMDVIRALGVHVPAGRQPILTLHPSEKKEAEKYLQQLHILSPFLVLNLGASRPTKSWPIDRFASLAMEWAKSNFGSVLAIGGPSEAPLIHTFLKILDELLTATFSNSQERSLIRERVKVTHDLPLRKLAAVLSLASVVVGNDSGPKHLAVSVGTPTITLFGPEHPFEWHPYPKENHPYFFVENLPCRKDGDPGKPPWCGLSECIQEEHRCMKLLGVNEVFLECQRMMRRSKSYA
jgi:ADP-heptose:LPS heptosyltransferase